MTTAIKISSLCVLLTMQLGSYGQAINKNWFKLHPITLGFYHGVNLLDVSRNGFKQKQQMNGIMVNVPLVNHIVAELRVAFSEANAAQLSCTSDAQSVCLKQAFNMPLSLQYYFMPQSCKIQPYFGMGAMLYSRFKNPEYAPADNSSKFPAAGNRYISIMFTQGATFEVNTKINITESLHFYKADGKDNVGFNIGIGFKLP
ncbi:MAG: hypothetical protein H7257_13520 [Taibaiella sp.]|nr:hypothetical protein [Taibaiella sp.]